MAGSWVDSHEIRGLCFLYPEVLDQVRFHAAKQKLQDGNMSITDISQRLGYSDATHFSRAFRSVTGVTPHLYRQQSLR